MKYSFIFGLAIILIIFSLSNIFYITALAEDSFVLNATGIPYTYSGEGEDSYLTNMDLKFSSSTSLCRSSTCIAEIPDSSSVRFSAPTGTESLIHFNGDFFIRDEANKDLTPKKKDLVETWNIDAFNIYESPSVTDIVENMENNQTVYYFDGILTFKNNFKNLEYEYDMKGFYQLPERIVQINGTR
jgi:hypothetical protein